MSSRFQIININTVTVINQETVYLRYKAIAIYIHRVRNHKDMYPLHKIHIFPTLQPNPPQFPF
jgi:hypothetical protein